jgi:hypothetical protein
MIPLTVNNDVAGVLGGYTDTVEVRDEQGRLLGHFLPYLSPEAREVYARAHEWVDGQEIQRIAETEQGKGRPLAEVLQGLRSVGNSG